MQACSSCVDTTLLNVVLVHVVLVGIAGWPDCIFEGVAVDLKKHINIVCLISKRVMPVLLLNVVVQQARGKISKLVYVIVPDYFRFQGETKKSCNNSLFRFVCENKIKPHLHVYVLCFYNLVHFVDLGFYYG